MFFYRVLRHSVRSYATIILLFVTLFSTLLTSYLYRKNNYRQELNKKLLSTTVMKPQTLASSITTTIEKTTITEPLSSSSSVAQPTTNITTTATVLSVIEQQRSTDVEQNLFTKYSSDEHLFSLLQQQSNALKQVIITIIGGDSYSLFAWDWHERMYELSNNTKNCHCFIVAMDEIAVVLATKQGVPVYYCTFTFEQQMKWINNIEARQHSLYRVGYAKFNIAKKIVQMGYSVVLSEMDVFWRANPLDHLKKPIDIYDLQISDHFGSHPRVNIGLFFVRPTNASIEFFSYAAEFWLNYGKGAYLSDQRTLDALLGNYDRLDKTYLRAVKPAPSLNWTTHAFGNHFSHLMTDGSAFVLFNQVAKLGIRSKKYHGDANSKYFTVTVSNSNMPISYRNLLIRALLILQYTTLKDRVLILPAFASNLTTTLISSQLDVKISSVLV